MKILHYGKPSIEGWFGAAFYQKFDDAAQVRTFPEKEVTDEMLAIMHAESERRAQERREAETLSRFKNPGASVG